MALTFEKQAILFNDPIHADRIGQAVFTAAIAIGNEAPETPNHSARLSLAQTVLTNWALVQTSFLRAVATQLNSPTPSDDGISNGVSAVWNVIALAMFPG